MSEIKDKAVYSKNMIMLGKAKELEFDPAEMKATYPIVEFEKEAAKDLLGKTSMIGGKGYFATDVICPRPCSGTVGILEGHVAIECVRTRRHAE